MNIRKERIQESKGNLADLLLKCLTNVYKKLLNLLYFFYILNPYKISILPRFYIKLINFFLIIRKKKENRKILSYNLKMSIKLTNVLGKIDFSKL